MNSIKEFYSKSNKAYKYNSTISILFLLLIINVFGSWIVSLETEHTLATFNIIIGVSNKLLSLVCAIIWLISLPFLGKVSTLNIYEKPENYKMLNFIYFAITIANTILLRIIYIFMND